MSRGGGTLRYRILGPVEAERAGAVLHVGGPKVRAVLATLILEPNRVVSASRIVENVWGEVPPRGEHSALHVHVSALRKALGAEAIETRSSGYLLPARADQVDHLLFEQLVAEADSRRARGEHDAERRLLHDALDLWSGPALADLADLPFAAAAARWLEERRAATEVQLIEATIRSGSHLGAVSLTEAALRDRPYQERLWELLMLALYLTGRQAESLAAYQRARETFAHELGIRPGPALQRIEAAVLHHDPALHSWLGEPAPASPAMVLAETHRLAPARPAWLVGPDGAHHGLDAPTVLGRHPDCGIVADDASVSRRHAEIRPALHSHLLVDLASTNGTWVNGALVAEKQLTHGDVVEVGRFRYRYEQP